MAEWAWAAMVLVFAICALGMLIAALGIWANLVDWLDLTAGIVAFIIAVGFVFAAFWSGSHVNVKPEKREYSVTVKR